MRRDGGDLGTNHEKSRRGSSMPSNSKPDAVSRGRAQEHQEKYNPPSATNRQLMTAAAELLQKRRSFSRRRSHHAIPPHGEPIDPSRRVGGVFLARRRRSEHTDAPCRATHFDPPVCLQQGSPHAALDAVMSTRPRFREREIGRRSRSRDQVQERSRKPGRRYFRFAKSRSSPRPST